MIDVGHFAQVICTEGDGGDLAEIHNLRLVDAGRREKSEKKARIRGGQAAKKELGRLITPQSDTTFVGSVFLSLSLSLSHTHTHTDILLFNYFKTKVVVKIKQNNTLMFNTNK